MEKFTSKSIHQDDQLYTRMVIVVENHNAYLIIIGTLMIGLEKNQLNLTRYRTQRPRISRKQMIK